LVLLKRDRKKQIRPHENEALVGDKGKDCVECWPFCTK